MTDRHIQELCARYDASKSRSGRYDPIENRGFAAWEYCTECGAAVVDQEAHDGFHSRLSDEPSADDCH